MMKKNAIGILGGTFDPIHYGHLIAAEFARNEFSLEKIILIPAANPPHKDTDNILDSEHRYNMVKIACEDNPFFEVSSIEMERKGYSYTVDTLEHFSKIYPSSRLYFILGVDALQLIKTWKDVNRLHTLCNFIIVTRPGYKLNRQDECFSDLPKDFWLNTNILEIPGLDISSTNIRKRLFENKTIKYLLPSEVEKYIYDRKLYKKDINV